MLLVWTVQSDDGDMANCKSVPLPPLWCLCRRLGPGGPDPARLKQLPIASAAVWALYVGESSCSPCTHSHPSLLSCHSAGAAAALNPKPQKP